METVVEASTVAVDCSVRTLVTPVAVEMVVGIVTVTRCTMVCAAVTVDTTEGVGRPRHEHADERTEVAKLPNAGGAWGRARSSSPRLMMGPPDVSAVTVTVGVVVLVSVVVITGL